MPRDIMRGDTYKPLTGVISDELGPVPFGDADGLLLLRAVDDDTLLLELPVTVVDPDATRGDPDAGRWEYQQTADDVAVVDTYKAELQVTWPDGKITTFPNKPEGRDTVNIHQDLNPPV